MDPAPAPIALAVGHDVRSLPGDLGHARDWLVVSSSRRSGPTAIAERPASRSRSSAADELPTPAGQRADLGLGLAAAGGRDDQLELGARGDQLVGQAGLERPGPQQRLRERDQRCVAGLRASARPRRAGSVAPRSPRGDRGEDRVAAALDRWTGAAADLLEARRRRRVGAWRARPAPDRRAPSRPGGPRPMRSARARPRARGRPRARSGRAGRPAAVAPRRSTGRARRSRTRAVGTPRAPTRAARSSAGGAGARRPAGSRWATSSAA